MHETKDSCIKLRQSIQEESLNDADEWGNDIQLEVRWLYRPHEIPGVGKAPETGSHELEEVFETDHLDYCSADSILSPLMLHEHNQKDQTEDAIEGLPCIHYYCARFWSLHRKSFITSGSLSNRVTRGRMYSDIFGKHGTASAALKRLEGQGGDDGPVDRRNMSWQESFRSAIKVRHYGRTIVTHIISMSYAFRLSRLYLLLRRRMMSNCEAQGYHAVIKNARICQTFLGPLFAEEPYDQRMGQRLAWLPKLQCLLQVSSCHVMMSSLPHAHHFNHILRI